MALASCGGDPLTDCHDISCDMANGWDLVGTVESGTRAAACAEDPEPPWWANASDEEIGANYGCDAGDETKAAAALVRRVYDDTWDHWSSADCAGMDDFNQDEWMKDQGYYDACVSG
jgi:hypothetical protein